MARSFCNLLYHIVFSTKDREAWLTQHIRPKVEAYLGGAVNQEGGIPLVIGGMADHIHILARLRQDKTIADVLRSIKSNSSAWFRRTFRRSAFGWQLGYGAFTVSASQVARVRKYVAEQERHHRGMSFQEEFVVLLRAHGMEFDERYLWT